MRANRTFMELKHGLFAAKTAVYPRANRTFMELKQLYESMSILEVPGG